MTKAELKQARELLARHTNQTLARLDRKIHSQSLTEDPAILTFSLGMDKARREENWNLYASIAREAYEYTRHGGHYDFASNTLEDLDKWSKAPVGHPLPHRFGFDSNTDAAFYKGYFSVVGAFSGVGKTSVLLNIAHDAILRGQTVLMFTLEMAREHLKARMLTVHEKQEDFRAPVSYRTLHQHLSTGSLPESLKAFSADMDKRFFVVDGKRSAASIGGVYRSFLEAQDQAAPAVVLIDYLQLLEPENADAPDRRSMTIDSAMKLHELATHHKDSAWIIAAQTNRESQKTDGKNGRAAGITSFQESAIIEQTSGFAMTLGRPKDERGEDCRVMEMAIRKNRHGPEAHVFTKYDPASGLLSGKDKDFKLPEKGKK